MNRRLLVERESYIPDSRWQMAALAFLRDRVFTVPYEEVAFDYRGFASCDPKVKTQIEEYFRKFLDGYHAAMRTPNLTDLGTHLDREMSSEYVGFAYEGAGMYLALVDFLTPWRSDQLGRFLAGPAKKHDFITIIGAGLALARLPWVRWHAEGAMRRFDPGLGWFAIDGYGFHEGFFHDCTFIDQCIAPTTVSGYAARCFDHGLGRSIWFVKGAVPERIRESILAFPQERRGDLWAGIGLACAFAGGVHEDLASYATVIKKLQSFAAPAELDLSLGVVLAAYSRYKAGTASPWTSLACQLVLDMSFDETGRLGMRVLEETRAALTHASEEEVRALGYESARQTIMQVLQEHRRSATGPSNEHA
jgi:hypothetical protein